MAEILILRHHTITTKVNAKLVDIFLKEQGFECQITAPIDFVTPGVDQHEMQEKIALLVPDDNAILFIFFEANLGYPGREILTHSTIEVLKYLSQKCPEAMIVLKSNTRRAIKQAIDILKQESFPLEQVIAQEGVTQLTDELKEMIREKFYQLERSCSLSMA